MASGSASDPVQVRAVLIGTADDASEDGITITSIEHQRVHEGVTYSGSIFFADVANDASKALLLRTGGKDCHSIFGIEGGGDTRFRLYEGAVPSANGTAVTLYNLFRRSPNTPESTLYHTPTVGGGSEGTLLLDKLIPGGNGPQSGGGTLRRGTEWILKPATVYYILATNISGNTKDMSLELEFYEHDEVI